MAATPLPPPDDTGSRHLQPVPDFTWESILQQAQDLAHDLGTAGSKWQPLIPQLDTLARNFGALLLKHPEANRHLTTLVRLLADAGGKEGPGRAAVKGYLTEACKAVKQAAAVATREERSPLSEGEPLYQICPGADAPVDLVAARALLEENSGTLAFHARRFWRYNESTGYWALADNETMRRLAIALLERCYVEAESGDLLARFGSAADQRNTLETLQGLAGPGPLARTSPPAVIAFADGTYDLATGVLVPHSPHHGATFAVDAPWRGLQVEPPPVMLAFVECCYGIDALPIIRAVVRGAIDPTIRYGEAFHFLGESHSGKGLLLAVVQSLFPSAQVSALTHPSLLESPEKVYQFAVGRRLVTFPDCPHRAPRNYSDHPGVWYSLVVNENVSARRLHQSDTWEGQLHSRSVICSTTQLQLGDARAGYLSRVLTLPTLPRIGPKDPGLKASLIGGTEAHRMLRGDLAGWALAMPLEDVNAVLDRNDPAGILQETAAELAREADPPSQWADAALEASYLGPHHPVSDEDWQEMFDCYLLWCRKQNIRHEGNRCRFQGQIRSVLGTSRCLPRGKGPSPERRSLPRLDAGFQLRPGLMDESGGGPRIVTAKLKSGGLEALAGLPQAERGED